MPDPRLNIRVGTTGVGVVQRQLTGMLTNLKAWAAGVGAVVAGAVGLREVKRAIKDTVDALDKIGANAQRVGVAAESLSTLGYSAKLSKSNADELQASLIKLSRAIVEAADGTVTYADAFARAGVDVRGANGELRDTETVFLEIADVFKTLPDGPKKTAIAIDLLGRSGANLIPMLNQGSDGIKALQEEARRFGLEVSTRTTQAAGDFNDNLDRLGFIWQGLWNQITTQILPLLVDLSNGLVDSATDTDDFRRAAEVLANVLKQVAYGAVLAGAAMAILKQHANGASQYVSTVAGTMGGMFDTMKKRLGQIADDLREGEPLKAYAHAVAGSVEHVATVAKGVNAVVDQSAKQAESLEAVLDQVAKLMAPFLRDEGGFQATQREHVERQAHATRDLATITERKLDLDQTSVEVARARAKIEEEIASYQNDRGSTETQRYRDTLAARQRELALQDEYIANLRERFRLERDETTRLSISRQLQQAERARAGIAGSIGQMKFAGDPASLTAQMLRAADEIAARVGTLAQQVARAFTDVMGSAVDGIAGSFKGLITQTMTWKDALSNVAKTMGGAVVDAISNMFAEWIVGRLAAMAKNIFAAQAEGAAETAAKTPGALLTSISSWGTAAVVGLAALTAALAAVGGFATGGLVSGSEQLIRVNEQGPEFVSNAGATRNHLAELRAWNADPRGNTGGSDKKTVVNVLFDKRMLREALERDLAHKQYVVDTIADRRFEIG